MTLNTGIDPNEFNVEYAVLNYNIHKEKSTISTVEAIQFGI